MPHYKWELLIDGGEDNHKVFIDKNTNKYAIVDQSGHLPDYSENGVLFIVENEPIVICGDIENPKGKVVVEDINKERWFCTTTPNVYKELNKKLNMKVLAPVFL